MELALNIILILILCYVLIKSVSHLVASSVNLAKFLKISEYTVAFLVVAFATSLPELVVGIAAALDKQSILSLGNVVGSNIADLTIILAIPIFIGGAISTKTLIKSHDLTFGSLLNLLPVLLIFDGELSRFDGALLVLAYVLYVLIALRKAEEQRHFNLFEFLEPKVNAVREFVTIFLAGIALWFSADMIVRLAEGLSKSIGIPLLLVGLFITAFGTSLPELAFGLRAVKTKHKGEVIGSIMGSAVANSTLILGVTSLISPIIFSLKDGYIPYVFLLLILGTFFVFSLTRKQIGKIEAFLLCALYVAFLLLSI